MKLSVIIVTWNSKRIVCECLDSLSHYFADPQVEVIVVDNASSDGTPDLVADRFPSVRLLRNSSNQGFAAANNVGIRMSAGRYTCLVNSDVVVPAGCFEKMATYMDEHPDIGMLGPKMILRDGSVGQSCMRFPSVWNWFARALALDRVVQSGSFLMNDFRYDQVTDVDVLTGWFWMVRRQALSDVGLLDERFFMYGEDIDWSKRFHDAKWRVVFFPGAEATHYCGASSSNAPTRFYIEMTRANLQYCRRHHGLLAWCGFWLATLLHEVVRLVGYALLRSGPWRVASSAGHKARRSAACLLWLLGRPLHES